MIRKRERGIEGDLEKGKEKENDRYLDVQLLMIISHFNVLSLFNNLYSSSNCYMLLKRRLKSKQFRKFFL